MGRYRIRVATGAWLFSGTHNRVQLWLVGERGEAELELQLRPARGQVRRGGGTSVPARARPRWLGLKEIEHRGGAGHSRDPGGAQPPFTSPDHPAPLLPP